MRFLKIVAEAISRYGARGGRWVWNNKSTVYKWLNGGASLAWILDEIGKLMG